MQKFSMEFDHALVHQWASFSGDYNPIHFDLEHAILLGAETLVVHGMLAMLPVKAAIYELDANSNSNSNSWCGFRISLRFPIPQLTKIDVNIEPFKENGIVKYSGAISDKNTKFFHGSYKQCPSPVDALAAKITVIKRNNILPIYIERYLENFGDYKSSWIAIDAIVFSDFMNTQCENVKRIVEQKVLHVYGNFNGEELTVHINHEVIFDKNYFLNLKLIDLRNLNLSYHILEFNLIPSANEIVCMLDIPVYLNCQQVMKIGLGLLLKRKMSV